MMDNIDLNAINAKLDWLYKYTTDLHYEWQYHANQSSFENAIYHVPYDGKHFSIQVIYDSKK